MRSIVFVWLFTSLACILDSTKAIPIDQTVNKNMVATTLLDVDVGFKDSNEGLRKPRGAYGYYVRPFYGGYYGRPYYAAYGWPHYGGYGGYYRPYYYGGFGGYY